MTKEEYEQIYANGFRAGWEEAIKTLQKLEPPAIDVADVTYPAETTAN